MGRMKVLFLEDVGRHGRAGEVREVKNGYARNYLLPNKLAVPATKDHLQRIEKIRKAAEDRRVREHRDAAALAERINSATLTFRMRTSSTGRLFGSVTNHHIADRLSEVVGTEIDRRTVALGEPLRELGTYAVEVHLPQQVTATMSVVVEPEGAAVVEAEPTPAEAVAEPEPANDMGADLAEPGAAEKMEATAGKGEPEAVAEQAEPEAEEEEAPEASASEEASEEGEEQRGEASGEDEEETH